MRFAFAWKIGIATSLLALGTTGTSVYYIYSEARELTLKMMGDRLKDLGGAGTFLFTQNDRESLKSLRDIIYASQRKDLTSAELDEKATEEESVETLPPAVSKKIMEGAAFQRVVENLRKVRAGTKRTIQPLGKFYTLHDLRKASVKNPGVLPTIAYTYLYIPAPGHAKDGKFLIYLADGDYLPYDWEGDGKLDSEEDYSGNPIGNMVPAPNDEMRLALVEGKPYATPDWTEDKWGTWVAGFVPIKDQDGSLIAVLGMDLDVKSEANKVAFIQQVSIAVVFIAFVLAILLAMTIARILNRPVSILREGAERVANRDFSTRIEVKSRDELGLLANTFNEMVTEIREYAQNMEELNSAFERFVPKEFLQSMGQENIVKVKLGDQVQKEMTVLFTDIRSFTTLSESMTPKENFDFLNGYLGRVSPLIRSNHGFIDKFIGDAIMALFPRTADDAVRNSIEMLNELVSYNEHRRDQGYPPINIGIGLHTGNLMLGTIGEERRMEGTVISDAVNLASRLEGLTKVFGANILISEHSLGRVADKSTLHMRCLGKVRVKGKSEPVSVHEIFNGENSAQIELKERTVPQFNEALDLFQQGRLGDASRVFEEILRQNPDDHAAQAYVKRLARKAGAGQL